MFISFVIAWVFAAVLFYHRPELPSYGFALLVTFIALGCVMAAYRIGRSSLLHSNTSDRSVYYRRTAIWLGNLFFGFIIGWSWVFWQTFLQADIKASSLNQPVVLEGEVVGLPETRLNGSRVRIKFALQLQRIHSLESGKTSGSQPMERHWALSQPTVQLSWYVSRSRFEELETAPEAGQRWRFPAKLKANHGAMNIGALDYESWLYQHGIRARGYVLDKEKYQDSVELLASPVFPAVREFVAGKLDPVFSSTPFAGLYEALSYGDRHAISDSQWQTLQQTGTVHLMAISGLHMGIIAFIGYWVFKGLWWLGLYRIERLNLPMLGAAGALVFATFYLILAGFSIPTQRAYLMVLAGLLFLALQRGFQPWSALALAAWLVVAWDPASVLSLGFWLSFLAVAIIFATLQHPFVRRARGWQKLLWIQVMLTLGLAPFLIWSFHFLPMMSLPANLIAVPFVTFVGLPLVFLTTVLSLFSAAWAQLLTEGMDALWQPLWGYLNWLTAQASTVTLGSMNLWQLIGIYAGLFLFLSAQRFRLKQAGALLMAVILGYLLVAPDTYRPSRGEAQIHMLDVGQGQAVVIETESHVLVYDTGAKWGSKMDGAKLAILPFLRARQWPEVDQVMVSHSDMDHAGGLARLLTEVSVQKVLSGQPDKVRQSLTKEAEKKHKKTIESCTAGQKWRWDEVSFEVISPGIKEIASYLQSDNDRSCVLKVTAGAESVIITGDLGIRAEKRLIDFYRKRNRAELLQADMLIGGHHGSRYSTASEWLEAIKPRVVLFSSGYRNRYHFPAPETIDRLEKMDIDWLNTACSGGVGYHLGKENTPFNREPLYQVRKRKHKWYHHRCLLSEKGIFYQ